MSRKHTLLRLHVTSCIVLLGANLKGCESSKKQLATQTALAATATFEALPTATPTRTSTTIPTQTLTPTETPTETSTPTKTVTVAPAETEIPANWAEKYFIPHDQEETIRNNGGIIVTEDMKISEYKNIEVTRPGQYYAICDITAFKEFMKKNPDQIFIRFVVNPKQPMGKLCSNAYASRKAVEKDLKSYYPSEDDATIQGLIDKHIQISEAMLENTPDEPFLWDLYYVLQTGNPRSHPDVKWGLFTVTPDGKAGKYITSILIPTPTTTP